MTIEFLMWLGGIGVILASIMMSVHMRQVDRDCAGQHEGHLYQEAELLKVATTKPTGRLGDHLDKAA
jgi:hypothetical protein